MNNLTKMKINKSASEVFEAFMDPAKIGNFWFSSSSQRWESGKTITLKYDEYQAEGDIKITKIDPNKKIVFLWGEPGKENTVTISLSETNPTTTIVEVNEEGFDESDEGFIHQLIDNKEGWVYVLTCLKGYLEFGVTQLRAGLVK